MNEKCFPFGTLLSWSDRLDALCERARRLLQLVAVREQLLQVPLRRIDVAQSDLRWDVVARRQVELHVGVHRVRAVVRRALAERHRDVESVLEDGQHAGVVALTERDGVGHPQVLGAALRREDGSPQGTSAEDADLFDGQVLAAVLDGREQLEQLIRLAGELSVAEPRTEGVLVVAACAAVGALHGDSFHRVVDDLMCSGAVWW